MKKIQQTQFDHPLDNYLDKLFYIDGRGEPCLISYNEKTEEYTFFRKDSMCKTKIGTRPIGSGMGELIVLDEMSISSTSGWFKIDVTKELDELFSDFYLDYLSDIRVDVNGHLYSIDELSEDELEESELLVEKKGHSPFNGLNLNL